MGIISVCDEHDADPLFNLIWQEGTDHGEDRPEEHRLIDQMYSSDFQWKRVLNTRTYKDNKQADNFAQPIRSIKQNKTLNPPQHRSLKKKKGRAMEQAANCNITLHVS